MIGVCFRLGLALDNVSHGPNLYASVKIPPREITIGIGVGPRAFGFGGLACDCGSLHVSTRIGHEDFEASRFGLRAYAQRPLPSGPV